MKENVSGMSKPMPPDRIKEGESSLKPAECAHGLPLVHEFPPKPPSNRFLDETGPQKHLQNAIRVDKHRSWILVAVLLVGICLFISYCLGVYRTKAEHARVKCFMYDDKVYVVHGTAYDEQGKIITIKSPITVVEVTKEVAVKGDTLIKIQDVFTQVPIKGDTVVKVEEVIREILPSITKKTTSPPIMKPPILLTETLDATTVWLQENGNAVKAKNLVAFCETQGVLSTKKSRNGDEFAFEIASKRPPLGFDDILNGFKVKLKNVDDVESFVSGVIQGSKNYLKGIKNKDGKD